MYGTHRTISCTKIFPVNTTLYFRGDGGGSILISKTWKHDTICSAVARAYGNGPRVFCQIPSEAMRVLGMNTCKSSTAAFYYSLYEVTEGEEYRLSKQRPEEIPLMPRSKGEPLPGMVHRYRFLYLTQEQKDILQVPRCRRAGESTGIKMTLDIANKVELKAEPITTTDDEQLPTMRELLKSVGKQEFFKEPRTFKTTFQYSIILPAEFIRAAHVGMNDQLPVSICGNSVVVDGHGFVCDICGKTIHASQARENEIHICGKCHDATLKTTALIKSAGTIKKAMKEAKALLKEANRTLKEAERRMA